MVLEVVPIAIVLDSMDEWLHIAEAVYLRNYLCCNINVLHKILSKLNLDPLSGIVFFILGEY